MKKFTVILLSGVLLTVSSCIDKEIDLNNLDTNVQVLGENLILPLGTTKPMSLGDVFSADQPFDVDENGLYYFQYQEEMDISDEVLPFETNTLVEIEIPDATLGFSNPQWQTNSVNSIGPKVDPALPGGSFKVGFDDVEININALVNNTLVNNVELIDMMYFDGGDISFKLTVLQSSTLPPDKAVDFNIYFQFPDFFVFDDPRVSSNNVLAISGTILCDSQKPYILDNKVHFAALDFKGTHPSSSIHKKIVVSGEFIVDVHNMTYAQAIAASTGTFKALSHIEMDPIKFRNMYGIITYSLPVPGEKMVAITGIPEVFKSENTVLDLKNQALVVSTKSNVTVPIKSSLTVVPYYNNQAAPEKALNIEIDVPESKFEYPDTLKNTHFCVCDEGSVYKSSSDTIVVHPVTGTFNELFKVIPDKVSLSYGATTAAPPAGQRHILDLSASPFFDVKCNVKMPFTFGAGFKTFITTDVAVSLDGTIMDLIKKNKLAIVGDAISKIPMDLSLTLTLLDQNGDPIQEPGAVMSQNIKAHNPAQGEQTITKLNMELGPIVSPEVTEITGLHLVFNILHPQTPPVVSLTQDATIETVLALCLPKGIVVDLNELLQLGQQ